MEHRMIGRSAKKICQKVLNCDEKRTDQKHRKAAEEQQVAHAHDTAATDALLQNDFAHESRRCQSQWNAGCGTSS